MGYTPADPVAGKPSILTTNGVVNGAGYQPGNHSRRMAVHLRRQPGERLAALECANRDRGRQAARRVLRRKCDNQRQSRRSVLHQSESDQCAGAVGRHDRSSASRGDANANGTSNAVTADIQSILPGFFLTSRLLRRGCDLTERRRSWLAGETGGNDHVIRDRIRPYESSRQCGRGHRRRCATIECRNACASEPRSPTYGSPDCPLRVSISSTWWYRIFRTATRTYSPSVAGVRTQSLARLRVRR